MKKKSFALNYLFICLFIVAFTLWAMLCLAGHLEEFDLKIQNFAISIRNPIFTAVGVALEYVGHWPLPALLCAVLLIFKNTRFSYGLPLTACVLTSVGMYEILKHIFERVRPDEALWLCPEHGFSFPSGHSLNNMVFWVFFAGLVGYYFKTKGASLPMYKEERRTKFYPEKKASCRLIQLLLCLWPVIIGLSRIYVCVHWPSDVVGAWLLAVVILQTGYITLFSKD